jgi:hypothetical protein
VTQPYIANHFSTQGEPRRFVVAEEFRSFDKLKELGAKVLAAVRGGNFAKLTTKTGQYVVLEESDFQYLLGRSLDADRISTDVQLIVTAVQAVGETRNPKAIETLLLITQKIARISAPIRGPHVASFGSGQSLDEDDEYELDPSKITRPV